MICSVCGRTSESQAQYCSSCGTALASTGTPVPIAARQSSRLLRPREGRMVAGVCAGFAQAYGWDLTLVRLVVALSVLFAGLPVFAYLLAWIVMPNEQYALPAHTSARPGSMGL